MPLTEQRLVVMAVEHVNQELLTLATNKTRWMPQDIRSGVGRTDGDLRSVNVTFTMDTYLQETALLLMTRY